MRTFLLAIATLAFLAAPVRAQSSASNEPGLLFYVSADKGTTADFSSAGTPGPTFASEVTKIADGAQGAALQCGDLQRLAWSAPGNIYAQRGTLSFFWRARYAVGPTEFPIFRVGYADHSSWDMVWLRIDYNGHGFDAFVTDVNLARSRVSVPVQPFPAPGEWTHLALAWDETRGIRFFVNGKLAGKHEATAVYDAGLDQLGPHSRIISPYQVQSDYNFTRGGDIDEIRIYDRMLNDDAIAGLRRGEATRSAALAKEGRTLTDLRTRQEWWLRYGFNRPGDVPPALPAGSTVSVRKVEIHDAFDLKRWWWKATDGIRETTWPGVYNRSRLAGRNDYFQLPDWDCYVDSGKAITFTLPEEPWNHLELAGVAWGTMRLHDGTTDSVLFDRIRGQEKTVHRFARPVTGGKITFTNAEQEEPIAELVAYNVTAGAEPAGSTKLAFRIDGIGVSLPSEANTNLAPLKKFISGRYPSDEQTMMFAVPAESPVPGDVLTLPELPLLHILIPNSWDKLTDGLDGIAIDLPALNVKPTHGALVPLNIQVKDPLWPARNMLDFTFSVKPGEAKTLWFDLRDRLLPPGKPLYLTIAAAGDGLQLTGAKLRLVFKPRAAARPEHELDRFTQARDSYAMLVEEHPNTPKFSLWVRFKGDLDDLLRVNPDHVLGRQYAAAAMPGVYPKPVFTQPEPPAGIPLWAFRQTELLGRVKKFVLWYIDQRQVPYGDFGGGISDDVDLTNTWPGVALMGSEPEKVAASLRALLDAAYKNGMFTNGLPTIQADELHSYEEGINCLAQNLILDYGSPRQLERAMATARGVESITGINAAGHRHVRSSYYSGTKMAEDGPWGWSKPYSYLVLQVPQLLVDFNGNPAAKKYLLELADGLLAHRHPGAGGRGALPSAIHFATDREGEATRTLFPWHVFWGAWKFSGDRRYLEPMIDGGMTSLSAVSTNVLDTLNLRADWGPRLLGGERAGAAESRVPDARGTAPSPAASFRTSNSAHFAWQLGGDKRVLENLYASQIETCAALEFINTEGSLWIDRVGAPTTELQRARLGGVALVRNALYPGHVVSWKFAAPANDQSVAILIPDATPTSFKVIAYNLETTPVRATMTGWNIDPGIWDITQGVDGDNDDVADQPPVQHTADFERTRSIEVTLPPRATTILALKLKTPGKPYWSRPDLGIGREDVTRTAGGLTVKVHSLGSVPAPPAQLVFRDRAGRIVAHELVPALPAPVDLLPKTAEVVIPLPAGLDFVGGTVEIDPDRQLGEITTLNNSVKL